MGSVYNGGAANLPEVFESKLIVARKDHKCCECGSIIKPGHSYESGKGLWDHKWYTYKTCSACNDFKYVVADKYDGTIPPYTELMMWAR